MGKVELFFMIWKNNSQYKTIILCIAGLVFFIFITTNLVKTKSINIFFLKKSKIFIIKRN